MTDPRLAKLVASNDEGEFQALLPRNEQEAEILRWYAESARRFLEAVEGVLRVYEGTVESDRVVSLSRGAEMSSIERLERQRKASGIGKLQHAAGMFNHYVAPKPCDEHGNPLGDDTFAGFGLQEFHPRDGGQVPAKAQARYLVALVNAASALLSVAKAARDEHLSRPCRDMRCKVCMALVQLDKDMKS